MPRSNSIYKLSHDAASCTPLNVKKKTYKIFNHKDGEDLDLDPVLGGLHLIFFHICHSF